MVDCMDRALREVDASAKYNVEHLTRDFFILHSPLHPVVLRSS